MICVSRAATLSHSSLLGCWTFGWVYSSTVRGWRVVGSCLDAYTAVSSLFMREQNYSQMGVVSDISS
jgi:hypothetical protein